MTIQATLAENGVTPKVTINNAFTYAGHTFAVLVYLDDTSNDASWCLEPTFAGSYLGGVYPTMYAVIEAVDEIESALPIGVNGDDLGELVAGLLSAVRLLIDTHIFGDVA